MKKIAFFAVALGAVMLASCGNKTKANDEAQDSDSVSFEQSQIEQKMMVELDSISGLWSEHQEHFTGIFSNGKIQLSEDELKAKPSYLLNLDQIAGLSTLCQKYRALGILSVDQKVAELYKMDTADYKSTMTKLAADVNDPSINTLEKPTADDMKALYKSEKDNNRLNLFWEAATATAIESLYIISQNEDKFLTAFDDKTASDFTYHLSLLKLALDDLANYDADMKPIDEALAPLNELNAISVAQFKDQLAKVKPQIEAARAALLK